jgi:hypothetical protein
MGTRHLICVVKNGEYKVAQYGQWDGYPEGQGKDILNFLLNEMNREVFESKLSELSFITDEEYKQRWLDFGIDIDKCSGWVSYDKRKEFDNLYPENSRDTGAKILNLIQNSDKPLKIVDSVDFAANSLSCEWAYVIDLDKNTFEVYEGFNKSPLNQDERFANLKYVPEHRQEEYYPVKHVITFDLNNLPTEKEFLDNFKNKNEDEEE